MTVGKIFEFATIPEQSGLSSSIRLDAMIAQTLLYATLHIQYPTVTKLNSHTHNFHMN